MSAQYNPVGWFEIPVRDLGRAKAFYEQVFGIELEEHRMGPLLYAWFPMREGAIGAAGSLVKGEGYDPSDRGVLVYFTAPEMEAVLSRVKGRGGEVISGKTSIGEFGFIAIVKDTEGNRIGLHSRD
jgi:hypothetical protein